MKSLIVFLALIISQNCFSVTYYTRPGTRIVITNGVDREAGTKTEDSQAYTDPDGYLTGYNINCVPSANPVCFHLKNNGTELELPSAVVPPDETSTNNQGILVNDPPNGGGGSEGN